MSRAWLSERNASERPDIQWIGRLKFFGADHQREVFRIRAGLQAEGAADIVGQDAQPLLRQLHDRDEIVAQVRAPCEQARNV